MPPPRQLLDQQASNLLRILARERLGILSSELAAQNLGLSPSAFGEARRADEARNTITRSLTFGRTAPPPGFEEVPPGPVPAGSGGIVTDQVFRRKNTGIDASVFFDAPVRGAPGVMPEGEGPGGVPFARDAEGAGDTGGGTGGDAGALPVRTVLSPPSPIPRPVRAGFTDPAPGPPINISRVQPRLLPAPSAPTRVPGFGPTSPLPAPSGLPPLPVPPVSPGPRGFTPSSARPGSGVGRRRLQGMLTRQALDRQPPGDTGASVPTSVLRPRREAPADLVKKRLLTR